MIVHDKPCDRFVASGSCKRTLVFEKPVSDIRGDKKRCQILYMYRSTLSDHVIAVCFQDSGILITSLRSRRLEVVAERNGAREGDTRGVSLLACLLLARQFLLVPTTSKRLLRRLSNYCHI